MNVKPKLSRTFGTGFVSLEEGTRIGVSEIRIKVKNLQGAMKVQLVLPS